MEKQSVEELIGAGFVKDLGLPVSDGSLVTALMKKGEFPPLEWLTLRDLIRFSGNNDEALALLIILTLSAYNQGSLCLKLEEEHLKQTCRMVIGDPFNRHCRRIIDEMALISINKSRWSTIIGTGVDDVKPLILHKNGSAYMYFQKHLMNALSLQKQFLERLSMPRVPLVSADEARDILGRVIDLQKVTLNDQQRLAAAMALLQSFIVISGGPGTGKTSVIVVLLQCFLECGLSVDDIAVVAPTGRAAQRTTESIHNALPEVDDESSQPLRLVKGKTIHALLSYSPKDNGFRYNETTKLPYKVVIVDEVSMVDAQLMTSLLAALQGDARVLFLGDKDQLPSVEAGAVLAELIPPASATLVSAEFAEVVAQILPGIDVPIGTVSTNGLHDCTVVLSESYRSERSILDIAGEVNAGNTGVPDKLLPVSDNGGLIDFNGLSAGAYLAEVSIGNADRLHHVLDSWAACRYARDHTDNGWLSTFNQLYGMDLGDLDELTDDARGLFERAFTHLSQGQILTLLRQGAYGVSGINHYLGGQVRRLTDPGTRSGYFHGEPVIVRRNFHALGLSNGDLGIVVRGASGGYRAVFRQQNQFVVHAIDSIPALESAFAITVHKSQGSEYGDVLLVLPPNHDNPLLCKEILYTGITRARNRVCVVGSRTVLSAAVTRAVQRETGVNLWTDDGDACAPEDLDFTDLPLFQ